MEWTNLGHFLQHLRSTKFKDANTLMIFIEFSVEYAWVVLVQETLRFCQYHVHSIWIAGIQNWNI